MQSLMQIFNQAMVGNIINLKNEDWINGQRIAGKAVSSALTFLTNEIKNGTTKTFIQLDKEAEDIVRSFDCIPTFLNYKNFPNCCCISVNKNLVHGVPQNISANDGDKISFDLGATYKNGAIADAARTVIYGKIKDEKHKELLEATKEALKDSIDQITIGQRLGCIGETIYMTAKKYKLSVVERYGGHFIDWWQAHSHPFVSNRSTKNDGIRIAAGMSFAIEPLFVIGNSNNTKISSSDGWTVAADDICSHEENTVFIHSSGTVENMTRCENEN